MRPRWGLAAVLTLAAVAHDAEGQFARIAPPPPCLVPQAERLPLLPPSAAASAARGRPVLAIFVFERGLSTPERVHWAWSLPERLARRLSNARGMVVHSPGLVARALYEAGGGIDSASALMHAQFMLTGRVEYVEGQEEITVELRRAGARAPLWRAPYRGLASLRALEDTVAAEVVRRIAPKEPIPPIVAYPGNDAAYDALAAGEYHALSPTAEGADSAVQMFERALAAAPESPIVAARLAQALANAAELNGPPADGRSGPDRITSLVARAMERDSLLAAAWTARALQARIADPRRFGRAAEYHRRAVALAPTDAEAMHEQGITRLRLGDVRGAQESLRRALQLEPSRPSSLAAIAEVALDGGRWAEACAAANAAIGARPFDAWPYALRAQARLRLRQARDAFADAEIANRLARATWSAALGVMVARHAGDMDLARRTVQQETANWLAPRRVLSVRDAAFVARAFLAVGDRRRAIEALRRARPVGADLMRELAHADFAEIRADTTVARLRRAGAAGR